MAQEVVTVVSGVIERDGRYLLTQRQEHAVLPLLWEFPGGRVEEGESASDALSRELRYRLGVDVVVGEMLSTTRKDYGRYEVELLLFSCELEEQEPQPLTVKALRWVRSDEFHLYEFPPADKHSMDQLLF